MAAPDGEGAPGPSALCPAASGGLREPKTGVDFPRRISACSSWVVCMSCATCCVRSSTCVSRCFSCFCSSALERPLLDDGDFGSSANALLPHIVTLARGVGHTNAVRFGTQMQLWEGEAWVGNRPDRCRPTDGNRVSEQQQQQGRSHQLRCSSAAGSSSAAASASAAAAAAGGRCSTESAREGKLARSKRRTE